MSKSNHLILLFFVTVFFFGLLLTLPSKAVTQSVPPNSSTLDTSKLLTQLTFTPAFTVHLPIILKPLAPGSFALNSWPTTFQNTTRNGYNPYEQELTKSAIEANGLKLAWTHDLVYEFYIDGTSPLIATSPDGNGGVVYFSNSDIVALDMETGQPLPLSLSYRASDDITIDEQNLYYSSSTGGTHYIVASNRHTGETVWVYEMFSSMSSAPTLVNDIIYALSSDKNIYALNKNTGDLLWKYLTGAPFIYQTSAISNNVLYAKNQDEALYALDAMTGELKWSYPLDSFAFTSPVLHGNLVIFVDSYSIKALSTVSGTLAWEFEPQVSTQLAFGSSAIYSDTVYANANHRIFALDVETGDLVWQKQMEADIRYSISVVNGVLFMGSDDNKIYALDAANGNELWSYQTGFYVRTHPAIAGGKVIVASRDKKLYAFELQE